VTTNTRTNWQEVAAYTDEMQVGWLSEYFRLHEKDDRRDWLQDFIAGSLEVDEEERVRLVRSMLVSLLSLDDAQARPLADDFQYVLDHVKGAEAFDEIRALHTAARQLTVEDTMRLGKVWPRVFGKDIAATV
jgi:hypothetical protein